MKSIAQASFVGLTPSYATGKVIDLLWSATQSDPNATGLIYAAQGTNAEFAQYVEKQYGIESETVLQALGLQERTPDFKLDTALKLAAQQKSATDASSQEAKALLAAATTSTEQLADQLQQKFGVDRDRAVQELNSGDQSPAAKLDIASELAKNKLDAGTNTNNLLTAAAGNNRDFTAYTSKNLGLDLSSKLGSTEQPLDSKIKALEQAVSTSKANDAKAAVVKAKALAPVVQAASDARKVDAASSLAAAASGAKNGAQAKSGQNQIAQAAEKATAALTRPTDVGCSMTILSYGTTRYAFGQRVADEFIPVQIVVRNLNKNQEFLVHDAQVAVDEDINGRLGRYFSGTDKLTTRTFMLSANDFSKRSLTVHILQGVGTILSSTSLVYGAATKDAASVYSAGFLNALLGVWPDHSTDQLNLLNDEGFSSYRTERTVVPKSGTAEFVIFIRSDQFQEGWWVQDCAETIIIKNPENLRTNSPKNLAHCVGQFNLLNPDPKCLTIPEISIDLDDARRVCAHVYYSSVQPPKSGCTADSDAGTVACQPQLVDIGTDHAIRGDLAYFRPTKKAYKDWSPRAQAIFRELALAVVAGTHIQEQTATKPTLTKIDCPADGKGDVDFDQAENGNLTCPLTGTNLDKVQTLKLKNSADATDTNTASGTVTTKTSGNSKTTQAVFTLTSLGALSGKLYKVYTETTDGAEGGGDQPLHFSGEPYLPKTGKPTPPQINLADVQSSKDGVTVTLNGYHLDEVQSVQFAEPANGKIPGATMPVPLASGSTATAAKVAITSDNLKKSKISNGDQVLSISLEWKDSPKTFHATGQTLSLTGKLSAAPGTRSTRSKIHFQSTQWPGWDTRYNFRVGADENDTGFVRRQTRDQHEGSDRQASHGERTYGRCDWEDRT